MKSINMNVKGVTFDNKQGYIAYLLKNKENCFVALERDAKNKFDKNAIKVIGCVRNGKKVCVGFVPKDLAKELAPIMDKNKKPWVKSFSIHGLNKEKAFGMNLTVTY